MTDPYPATGPHPSLTRPPSQALYCTNWAAYGLNEIWRMVEHDDGRISWPQAGAWRRMEGTCAEAARRLRLATDKLASLWPPERSAAAKVFLDVVRDMVRSMEESAIAARTTSSALQQLTLGIAETRQKIAALIQQRNVYEQQHEKREREKLPWLRGYTGLIDHQRAQLDEAARTVMREADVLPAEANFYMQVPPRYTGFKYDPPAQPFESNGTNTSRGSAPWVPSVSMPPFDPPSPLSGVSPTLSPKESGAYPVLSGALAPAAHTAPTVVHVPGTSASTSWVPALPVVTVLPAYPSAGVMGGARSAAPPSPMTRTGATGSSTPAPSGRVGPPGVPAGPAMGMAPIAPPPVRSQFKTAGSGAMSSAVFGAGHRSGRPGDTDDPWAVEQGGSPVLEPSTEPSHHDPGPGVIGIDR